MFLSRVQVIITVLATHIIFPFLALAILCIIPIYSYFTCILEYLLLGNILIIMKKCGHWEFTFYSLSRIFLVLWGTLGIILIIKCNMKNSLIWMKNGTMECVFLEVLIICNIIAVYINFKCRKSADSASGKGHIEPLNIMFPCKCGDYLITDGGDGKISSIINYHYKAGIHGSNNTQKSMRFAVDIAKIGKNGTTTRKIFFDNNEDFRIFEEKIYCPIDGTVIKVVNDIKDNKVFPQKFSYNVGNSVVIKKDNYYLVIGHMQYGSIKVSEGDKVCAGEFIGKVGNSGLTPRPHIHMQLSKCEDGQYWLGEGVPIIFNDFVPIRNKIIHQN